MPNYYPVLVWDYIQRIIHWVIAFSVLLLIPLGVFLYTADYLHVPEKSSDLVMDTHAVIGLVFVAGILGRIIYFFAGPPVSRLGDVVPHTKGQRAAARATLRYYMGGFKGTPPLYLSHNAFAGIAYSIFFLFAIVQSFSGSTMYILHPETHMEANWPPGWLLDIHDLGALTIILFMLAHFGALAVHELVERRGLISSMVSGSKFFNEEELRALGLEIREKKIGIPETR